MIFAVLHVSRSTRRNSVHVLVLGLLSVKMQEPVYRLTNKGCNCIYTLQIRNVTDTGMLRRLSV